MNIDIFKQNKAIEVKPFELSLWKDELVTKKATNEVTNEREFLNIYPGLDTDENDLSFWYRTHNNSDVVITKNENNNGQIKIKIKEPEERENNLVHLDLSTSNLIFKPNTYYVFYTEIDFDFEDGKLPDLTNYIQYYQAHPTGEEKDSHIFFSLVRQDTPNSIWDMPHPIFDSSLVISVQQGNKGVDFNLLQTSLSEKNEYEAVNLFIIKGDDDLPQKLLLIGRLKTNNFLQENYTLGMWSFFESWLGDDWCAKVNIKVMEEQLLENQSENQQFVVYETLYKDITGNTYSKPSGSPTEGYKNDILEDLKRSLPDQDDENSIPFSGAFGEVQALVEEQIINYFQNRNSDFEDCNILIQAIKDLNTNQQSSSQSSGEDEETDDMQGETPKNISEQIQELKNAVNNILKDYGYNYYDVNGEANFEKIEESSNTKHDELNENLLAILKRPFYGFVKDEDETGTIEDDSINVLDNGLLPLSTDEDIQSKLNAYYENFFNTEGENKIYKSLNNSLNQELPGLTFINDQVTVLKEWFYCINTLMHVATYKEIFLSNINEIFFSDSFNKEYKNTASGSRYILCNAFFFEVFLNLFFSKKNRDKIKKYTYSVSNREIDLIGLSNQRAINNSFSFYQDKKWNKFEAEHFTEYYSKIKEKIADEAIIIKSLNLTIQNIDSFTSINFTKKEEDIQYLKEIKYLIFGAPSGPKSFAQDIVLNLNTTNEMNNLTFSLFDSYYNEFGKFEKNPYIPLLQNESKIKLYYDNEWYDFIITEVDFNRIEEKYSYTAKDANAIELSKTGFNKTFNTELDNNVGTINELAKRVLEGSDWELDEDNTETFIQYIKRPVFGGILEEELSIQVKGSFYDDSLVKSTTDNKEVTFSTGSYIYLFYNTEKGNNKPRIIVPAWDKEYRSDDSVELTPKKEDYLIIDNTLTNVFLCDDYTISSGFEDISFKTYSISDSNNIKIETIDIFTEPLDFDYSLRAKDIIISPKTHYSVPLKRYVTEYSPISNDNSTGANDKILYGYSQSEYTTKPLVQNLLPNGKDFVSLDGWITNNLDKKVAFTSNLAMLTVKDDFLEEDEEKYRTALILSSKKNLVGNELRGFLCNTDLGYNTAALKSLNPGDEFILQVTIETGNDLTSNEYTDDRLFLLQEMIPSLYFYNDTYTLQNETGASAVLPKKQNQVMWFLQDKRYKEEGKYYSGFSNYDVTIEDETIPNTSKSTYDAHFKDLQEVTENHSLVPIYYFHRDQDKGGRSKYPCAYVAKLRAERWKKNGYVFLVEENEAWSRTFSSTPPKNTYIFSDAGWNRFITMFRKSGLDDDPLRKNTRFNFKDFAIIIYFDVAEGGVHPYTRNMTQLKTELDSASGSNDLFGQKSKTIKYYLPMLFTDKMLKDKLNKQDNIDDLSHTFFRNDDWETVLQSEEYYTIEPLIEPSKKVIPHNINIVFGKGEEEYIKEDDFDTIIKIRAFWYLRRYSKTGQWVIETNGMFFGKTFLNIATNEYSYKKEGYTHEDLLSSNLGLFFTVGNLSCDNETKYGDLLLTLSNFQFFRKFTDENNNIYEPSEFIESNTTPIYKLYDPDKNKDVLKEEDMIYDYTDIKLTGYEPVLDLTGERKNSITITESNRYDLLQKLAEVFEGWLVIKAEHDENGAIALDENNKPKKKVSFINIKYNNNYMGVRYGANLKNLQRKIDSNDIVTKMIVKNNNNEFGENGFCSIARSKYNFSGSNSIFNIDYLIQTKILPKHIKDKLYNSIYLRTYNFGQAIKNFNIQRITQSTKVLQLEVEKEYYQQLLNAAVEKQTSFQDKFTAYSLPKGYSYYRSELNDIISKPNEYETDRNDINAVTTIQDITATIIALDYYNYLIKNTRQKLRNVSSEMTTAKRQYNSYIDIVKSLTQQRDSLLQEFENLCQGYIREGAWTSEDYIDDDLYYFDGEKQLEEMSKPHVTYTIDVVDIPFLYNYKLRDKTFVEDPEVFGYDDKGRPAKEEILITGKSIHLQSPDKNTITVQNYRTSYDDLFQRIASTIQAVEYGTLNYPNKRIYNDIEIRTSNNETRTVTI